MFINKYDIHATVLLHMQIKTLFLFTDYLMSWYDWPINCFNVRSPVFYSENKL